MSKEALRLSRDVVADRVSVAQAALASATADTGPSGPASTVDEATANPAPRNAPETLRARRGHAFYPPANSIPALYETDGVPFVDKPISAHYFSANSDFYIAEYDPETGEAFGYAVLNGDQQDAEWGYIPLPELERTMSHSGLNIVERDLYWDKQPFGNIKNTKYYRQP